MRCSTGSMQNRRSSNARARPWDILATETQAASEGIVRSDDTGRTAERKPTGVPGLDTILAGGLLRRESAIIQGAPGSGKTVLANQIAFHQVSRGKRVLYVTLLTETHASLLRHMRSLTFFSGAAVGDSLVYLSGFQALREGTSALLTVLQQEVLARRPALLVVDGLSSIQELHGSAALRQFLHELQTSTESANCTCLLLSANDRTPSPEDAVVDTVIFLSEEHLGLRSIRQLRVNKSRGRPHIHGRHTFKIDEDGVTVYPRIEALYRSPSQPIEQSPKRVRFEQDVLDLMLGGGLPAGSSALLLGATGTGKTITGLSFLAGGLRHDEPAIYAGFYEVPSRVIASGEGIGLGLQAFADSGRLHIIWQAPVELSLDVWGHRLINTVREHRPTRLFIDGFNALQHSSAYPDRLTAFLTALLNEVKAHGVTTLMSAEQHPIIGPGVDVPLTGVSPMVETTILLRYVEVRSQLLRMVAVLKVRGSGHEIAMREFRITSRGLEVGSTFDSAEAILSGSARVPNTGDPDNRHGR
jgi:circadian clock protein KaiC